MSEQPKTDVPSTTSEPGYAGSQAQRQPSQDGESPDEAGQVDAAMDRDDLLNGGSGVTDSPVDPPNQGADPDADRDLLHGGSGEPG